MKVFDSRATKILFIATAALVGIWGLRYIGPIFAPIFFACTLMILIYPLLMWLMSKGLPKMLAVIAIVLGIVVFSIAFCFIVYISLNQLIAKIPEYQTLLATRLQPIIDWLHGQNISIDSTSASSFLNSQNLAGLTSSFLSSLLSNVVVVAIFLFTLLLLVISSPQSVSIIKGHLGEHHPFVEEFTKYAKLIQKQYGIQTLSNFLSAVAITAELLFFGVDFALLWGLLAFVLGYIPNIGLLLATIPAMILAFIQFGLGTAIIIFIVGFCLNLLMDNVVTPQFYGYGLGIPVVITFLSFLFWSWMFGPLGALICIPLTLGLRGLFAGQKETKLLAKLLGTADGKKAGD